MDIVILQMPWIKEDLEWEISLRLVGEENFLSTWWFEPYGYKFEPTGGCIESACSHFTNGSSVLILIYAKLSLLMCSSNICTVYFYLHGLNYNHVLERIQLIKRELCSDVYNVIYCELNEITLSSFDTIKKCKHITYSNYNLAMVISWKWPMT